MVGRCIAYRNSPFFGGHVTFPGCNHKESMSIFGDTQLLMSEISQSWPGHLFENWKITLQTPTKHRLNRLITVGMLWGRPIRTWGPRDFNLIGNPELANCNELLRVKGEGRHTRSPRYRNVQESHFNLCNSCTPSLYPIQLCTMITTRCIRFWNHCLRFRWVGGVQLPVTGEPGCTCDLQNFCTIRHLDAWVGCGDDGLHPRSLTQPLKNGAFGHYFLLGR